MKLRLSGLLLIVFFISSIGLFSAEAKHVSFVASPSNLKPKAGENFVIGLKATFETHWHTYSLEDQSNKEGIGPTPTEITVAPEALLKSNGKVVAPKAEKKYDEGFEMEVATYGGTQLFEIPVTAAKDLDFTKDSALVKINLQLCDTVRCLPPEEYTAVVTNALYTPGQVKPEIKQGSATDGQSDTPQKGGIFSFLWVAMVAGLGALLTPCVFPMVPITVSFFTKRTEQSKGKGLRDALVYAVGIIVTFTSIGFIFSILFGATGVQEFAKNPWVFLFIAAIFILFTFNLFGAYELQLPTGLINKLDAKSRSGSGLSSVILMALTFSLASFSCTGPLVGAALIAASNGQWFYPIISMLGFSTVLAAPFFLLALFPSALTSMPKAGGWMNNLKAVLGFIVLGTSLYFINNALTVWEINIFSRELFLSILVGISALTTLYILGVFKLTHDSPVERVGSIRIIFAMIFAALTFYFVAGLTGKSLGELETYIPQSENQAGFLNVSNQGPGAEWITDYAKALEIAKKENKSIFIDFTGKTCTNCKKMEKTIFPRQSVQAALNKMVKTKLVTDINKEPYLSNKQFQLKKFNSVELPMYVILSPDEQLIAMKAYTPSETEFVDFLNKGIR